MHFFSVFSAVFPWERASLPSSMRQKKLTGTKRYLLTFCSSPSPAFSVFLCYLNCVFRTDPSWFVFGVLYGSNFLTGFLFRLVFRRFLPAPAHRPSDTFRGKKEMSKQTSKGNLLDTSIMNGFEIITQFGGYIILFSILSGLLMDLVSVWFRSPLPAACGNHDGIAQLAASSLSLRRKSLYIPLPAPPWSSLSLPRQTVWIHNSGLPSGLILPGSSAFVLLSQERLVYSFASSSDAGSYSGDNFFLAFFFRSTLRESSLLFWTTVL